MTFLSRCQSFEVCHMHKKHNVTPPQLKVYNNLVFVISLGSHPLYQSCVTQLLVTYPNPEVIVTLHTCGMAISPLVLINHFTPYTLILATFQTSKPQ